MRNHLALVLALPLFVGIAACGSTASSSTEADAVVTVTSSDTACDLSAQEAVAGPTTFQVKNTGSQVSEFYVYASDGTAIVGEVENIGPGVSRQFDVALEAGDYVTACKPGMKGDGLRDQFTVTEADAAVAANPAAVAGSAAYVKWVNKQAEQLLAGTKEFAAAVKSGNTAKAKELYPQVRMYWERIEPVAESFGDLDPKIDARINDLEPGQAFTGWHRLERDLWTTGLKKDSGKLAEQMVKDTKDLVSRIAVLELTADRITNGSKELLDEVASGKITGEEERYSHTDLWDFQANVEGSFKGHQVLRPLIIDRDPQLAKELDKQFAAMFALLDDYRQGDGFVSYTDLSTNDVRLLSAQLEALSEPVSKMTAVVLQ
ncbi:MAG: iron uptake system protein EfeO [Candidatus Nanopelagicales bacterium]